MRMQDITTPHTYGTTREDLQLIEGGFQQQLVQKDLGDSRTRYTGAVSQEHKRTRRHVATGVDLRSLELFLGSGATGTERQDTGHRAQLQHHFDQNAECGLPCHAVVTQIPEGNVLLHRERQVGVVLCFHTGWTNNMAQSANCSTVHTTLVETHLNSLQLPSIFFSAELRHLAHALEHFAPHQSTCLKINLA